MQELSLVELRKLLLLSLDDLLVITSGFINSAASRSALDRCLRRYGVGRLKDLIPQTEPAPSPKSFKAYELGYVHIDVKYLLQMPDETQCRYLFVGINRATRWVYMEVLSDKTATSARLFLKRLVKRSPFKVRVTLTDNGKEFIDRFCATGKRVPTGKHPFGWECKAQGIEHRLIKPKHPQTNGMVERFNGRIADILRRMTFESLDDLADTLQRYGLIYNQHTAQKALGHTTPLDKFKGISGAIPYKAG